MARISLIESDQASPEVREIYEQKLRGKPGNAQKAMAHRPEMLKNFLGVYASVGRSLDRKILSRCHPEQSEGSAVLRHPGELQIPRHSRFSE